MTPEPNLVLQWPACFRIACFLLATALGCCGQVAQAQPAAGPKETFTGSVKGIVDETGAIANLYGTF